MKMLHPSETKANIAAAYETKLNLYVWYVADLVLVCWDHPSSYQLNTATIPQV
jgi:hypothetical protein